MNYENLYNNLMDSDLTSYLKTEEGQKEAIEAFGQSYENVIEFGDQKSPWHQYPLLEHITRVADNIEERDVELKIAGALHDIGKAAKERVIGEDGIEKEEYTNCKPMLYNNMPWLNTFPGHAYKSEELSREILDNLYEAGWDFDKDKTLAYIKYHDSFMQVKDPNNIEKVAEAIQKINDDYEKTTGKELSEDFYHNLIKIMIADVQAQAPEQIWKDKDGNVIPEKTGDGGKVFEQRYRQLDANLDKVFEYLRENELKVKCNNNPEYSGLSTLKRWMNTEYNPKQNYRWQSEKVIKETENEEIKNIFEVAQNINSKESYDALKDKIKEFDDKKPIQERLDEVKQNIEEELNKEQTQER